MTALIKRTIYARGIDIDHVVSAADDRIFLALNIDHVGPLEDRECQRDDVALYDLAHFRVASIVC